MVRLKKGQRYLVNGQAMVFCGQEGYSRLFKKEADGTLVGFTQADAYTVAHCPVGTVKTLKNGLTIIINHKCSWCGKVFATSQEHEAHRVDGKTIDEATGKFRRICPFKCQEFGKVTAKEINSTKEKDNG